MGKKKITVEDAALPPLPRSTEDVVAGVIDDRDRSLRTEPELASSDVANPIVAPATFAEAATQVEELVSTAVQRTAIVAELIEADEATANMGAAPEPGAGPGPFGMWPGQKLTGIGVIGGEVETLIVPPATDAEVIAELRQNAMVDLQRVPTIEEQLIAALGVNGQITIEPHGQFRVKPHGVMRFGHGKTLANALYDLHHPGQLPSAIDGQQTHG